MKGNKVMKRCIKIGLGILLNILLLVLLNGPIYAQTDGKTKYWKTFIGTFSGGFATGPMFVNNQNIIYWGFADPFIGTQIFSGYQMGAGLALRPAKYFDLFSNIYLGEYKLLMGIEGHPLIGPAIWVASGGTYDISPPLPQDIYYISDGGMMQIGVRLIYPVEKYFEPYIGLGLNIGAYKFYFGNKDGSEAYSEILYRENMMGLNLSLGVNFNIFSENKLFLTISPYFELGGLVSDVETMPNWIWMGWTYSAQFPIVPRYRFGIILGG